MFLFFSIIPCLLFLAFRNSRKSGFFIPANLFIWFNILNVVILTLYAKVSYFAKYKIFSAMPVDDIDTTYSITLLVYTVIIITALLSSYSLKRNLDQSQPSIITINALPLIMLFWGFLFILIFIHFFFLDKDLLLSGNGYLGLNNPSALLLPPQMSRILHFLIKPIGLIAFIIFSFFFAIRQRLMAIIFLSLSFYPLLLIFVQNSRWLPMILVIGLIVFHLYSSRRRIFYKFFLLSLTLVCYLKAMVGRNTRFQGLADTFEIIKKIEIDMIFAYISGIFLNAFQGAINLANTFNLDPKYPLSYKLTSFSPFPSFVDNYAKIAQSAKIPLSPFVPVNAFGESLSFGIVYFIVFLLCIFIWLRVASRVVLSKNNMFSVFVLGFSFWITMQQSQYSFRTSFRQMLFISCLCIIYILINRIKLKL